VKAAIRDGKLVFLTGEEGGHWCLEQFRLTDRSTGELVWHIDPVSWTDSPDFCTDDFPLTYGEVPRWMKVVVPPKPLQSGRTYEINGTNGNGLSGAFIFNVRGAMINVEPEKPS
jgi:hypothetical protein